MEFLREISGRKNHYGEIVEIDILDIRGNVGRQYKIIKEKILTWTQGEIRHQGKEGVLDDQKLLVKFRFLNFQKM